MTKVLVIIDSNGVDGIIDISQAELLHAENELLGANKPIPQLFAISSLKMRMRMNFHRNPQAYLVEIPMDFDEIANEIYENKYFRELIEEKGTKFKL